MRALIAAVSICLISTVANAHTRHHHHHHHHHHRHTYRNFAEGLGHGLIHMLKSANIVRRDTEAGPIRVAAAYADRFVGFINALVRDGHKPKDIGCYSPTGHMHNSKHHWGGACDIEQDSRNKTASYMYHVAALAHEYGLTDGCEWRNPDCGHVEVPGGGHYARRTHLAHHHFHHRHYAGA